MLSQMARFLCLYLSIYHNFFIHSSTDGYLGCFHILALEDGVGRSWCIYLFMLVFLFSLNKYPEAELLDRMVVLFLIF